MDIIIYGTGAIGSVLAIFLQKANILKQNNIHLIGRGPYLEVIKKNGLIYLPFNATTENQWIHVHGFQVYTDIHQVPNIDLIFLTMKAHSLEKSLLSAKDMLQKFKPKIVITMNGMGLKAIVANYVPETQIIETVANYPTKIEGNKIINNGGNSNITVEDTPFAHQTLESLFDNNFDLRFDPKFKITQWTKFIINTGMNAVASIPLLTIGEVLSKDTLRKIIEKLIAEAVLIATREGIQFEGEILETFWKFASKDLNHRTSTQLDVINHKPTEVEFFNGYIVRKGREFNISTPANSAILTLMNIIEGKI